MRKKWISLLLVAAVALSILGGCTPSESPTTETSVSEVPEEEASPAEKSEAPSTPSTEATAETTEAAGETRIIVDHNGTEVEIPTEINRIAVAQIYPLPAMISMYLQSAEKIVGIHSVSMAAAQNGVLGKVFPELLEADTGWMQGDALNIEELIKLDPDVVFYTATNSEMGEMLKSADIPAIGVHATKWEYDCIETFDQWVDLLDQVFPGQENVAGVSEYSREVLADIQSKVKDIPEAERKKVLFIFQYDAEVLTVSGEKFFGQYWITSGGGVNAAAGLKEPGSQPVSMEQIYEWNPEMIFITNFTPTQPEDLYTNNVAGDDWSSVAAVQNKQVYKMPLGIYRSFTPGVDTPLTLMWVAKTMYPEIFTELNMEQEVKNYYQKFFGITLTDEDVHAMYNPANEAGVAGFER